MTHLSGRQTQEVELKKKMRKMKIFEKDIKESFVRSSGPGGQNVNKVSTCVTLTHLPTGIQVKCQKGRTQGANRFYARCQLVYEIEKQEKNKRQKVMARIAKTKRQNRKRPKALKEEILQDKHKLSEKKASRKKIKSIDLE